MSTKSHRKYQPDEHPGHLKNKFPKKENDEIVVFLGAGANWDSGLPLGDSASRYLIESIFKRCNLESLISNVNPKLGYFWPRFEVVVSTFERYIRGSSKGIVRTFFDCGISSTCRTLSRLSKRIIWITTNFDNQIELALEEIGKKFIVISEKSKILEVEIDPKLDLIIKVHGDGNAINTEEDLGASIEQILREFPLEIESNLIQIANNKKVFFIGYAARDPDLHKFISKLSNSAKLINWIDIGDHNPKIERLIGKKYQYHSEGSPRSLQKIFALEVKKPIRYTKKWETRVDDLISTFDSDSLINIVADLCLETGNRFHAELIDILHKKISEEKIENIFHKLKREVKIQFQTPKIESRDSIKICLDQLNGLLNHSINSELNFDIRNFLANTYWKTDSPNRSIPIFEDLLKEVDEKEKNFVELLINYGISLVYSGSNNLRSGVEHLKRAKRIAKEFDHKIQLANACLRLSIGLMRGNNPIQAQEELMVAKPIFEEIGNPRQIFIWKINLAECYRIQRNFKESIKILQSLVKQAELSEDIEEMITAKNNLALNMTSIGELKKADNEFKSIVEMSNELEVIRETKPNALYNRGWLRAICFLWEESIIYFEKAAESFKTDYFSKERRGGSLSMVGIGYFFINNFEESKKTLKRIIDEDIVPSGLFGSDFKLLQFLNSNKESLTEKVEEAQIEFQDDPEQLFYLKYYLLNKDEISNLELDQLIELARKANLNSYWGLLKAKLSHTSSDFDRTLILENFAGDFEKVIQGLKA